MKYIYTQNLGSAVPLKKNIKKIHQILEVKLTTVVFFIPNHLLASVIINSKSFAFNYF
jgi:hypothetical protein